MADPTPLAQLTRDQDRDRFRRDYGLRNPNADTSEGTDVWNTASAFADGVAPLRKIAADINAKATLETATGAQLDDAAAKAGTSRLPATGASGAVRITAVAGGVTITAGLEGKIGSTRYRATTTRLYVDGDEVPVAGIDTGEGTNALAGTVLSWTTPPSGLATKAIVVAQADGTGLTGGHAIESDDELRARIRDLRANPPASGNDAAYQAAVARTQGVPVQRAFTYPAILGPGKIGITFTLRPPKSGGSRIPNVTHLATALAQLKGQFPADDGILMCALVANPIALLLRVTWAVGAAGWTDGSPWPAYNATPIAVLGSQPISPTTFSVGPGGGTAPQVGQSVGVFDLTTLRFRRKKILSVTTLGSSAGWTLTVDVSTGLSDASFVPAAGQAVCPWSDSLDLVVPAVVGYFDSLGPGEQLADFFDGGLRERRSPPDPQTWPSAVTNRLLPPVLAVPAVQDAAVASPVIPAAAPVGYPGTSSYLNTLANLAIFPQ